jgi:hypothetical protein
MNASTTVSGEKCGLVDVRQHAALGIVTLAVAISMLLAGCVLSVEPVITESEAIFDSRLTGHWEMIDGSDRATITWEEEEYSIEYTEGPGPLERDEVTRTFGGRLGLLGDRMVLEVWPVHTDETMHGVMLLRGHTLFQIEIGEEEIAVASLETHVMFAALERSELNLAYSGESDEERIVLRGSSEELRSALRSYLQTPGALAEKSVFRRVTTVQPPATN